MFLGLDATILARLQFAFTITFHIVFPAFTIGLASYIATLEGIWFFRDDDRYHRLARFWTKIFAVSFAMGVVSGLPMSYQFGTNWSKFSVTAGNVIGPLLGYEVLTAFFLEASFLGIMLFGWNRVPKGLHFFASLMVAFGTLLSAFWILSANSWMQYPTGFEMKDGVAIPADWIQVIFNPTFPYRLAHMVTAAYLTTAIVVLAVGARYRLANTYQDEARIMIRMGLGLTIVLAPLQLFIGDQHGLATAEYQPAKLAAMEAHWDGSKPGELVLFAIPDEAAQRNDYQIGIPHGASLIIRHSWDGLFKGLNDFKPEDRPPVWGPFFAFRIMVAIGLWLILLAFIGAFLWQRGRLFESRAFMRAAALSWPLGFIAIIAGWVTTEVGRQPWVATGLMRTAEAASPVQAGAVGATLILFILVYLAVYSAGIAYMNLLIRKGPVIQAPSGMTERHVPQRPISAATETHGGPTLAEQG
ncbi:MAG: cytochrome ubiquinol oxidase subunit I [Rhodomicrobium sp.]